MKEGAATKDKKQPALPKAEVALKSDVKVAAKESKAPEAAVALNSDIKGKDN